MNYRDRAFLACMAGIAAALLSACGGTGGNDGASAGINGGGRDIAQGPISGFGSVVVNGVRFETTGATIVIDGVTSTEAGLATGLVVRVEGRTEAAGQSGRADRIVHESAVRGPVQAVDLSLMKLTVLGQTVLATKDTILSGFGSSGSFDAVRTGDLVSISGFVNAAGENVATRIALQNNVSLFGVAGPISAIDSTLRRFRINALTVDYASAVLEGFAGAAPTIGQQVSIKGSTNLQGGILVATNVSLGEPGVPAAIGDSVDVAGLVTRFASASDFDVSGQRVTTSAATQFVGGSASGIAIDAQLDVRGQRNAAGALVAERIEFLPVSNVVIEATLEGIDSTAGTLRLVGIDVITNSRTRYDDDDDRTFGFANLRTGDSVQIAGYVQASRFVATRVSRDDDGGTDVEIEGPVTDLAAPAFRIGGVAITTNAQTEFESEGSGSPGAAGFFATALGRNAEVEGTWNGAAVLALEVEIED